MGLIDRLFVADTGASLLEQVLEYASQFTTPAKAAMAVGRIKRSVQTGAEIPLEYGLALERELQQQLFQSEDAKEGLDAYVNKRKAEFKGR
jgi:enoyl-CoA hydratase/carnithine racemase